MRKALTGVTLFLGMTACPPEVATQLATEDMCYGPHERHPTRSVRGPGSVLKLSVAPRQTVSICMPHADHAVVLSMQCMRSESTVTAEGEWQCPLNADCFGGGTFSNLRKESQGGNQTCIDFYNSWGRAQNAHVVFEVFVP